MEIWDAYSKEGKPLGVDLIRGQNIPKDHYHLVVEILVLHADGSILVMQRDFDKEGYPGKYEASAGGSVLKGESPEQGALRELYEETGIKARVQWIGSFMDEQSSSIFHQYVAVTKEDKTMVRYQEGETIGHRWLSQEEFFTFIETDDFVDLQRDRILAIKDKYMERLQESYDCFRLGPEDLALLENMNEDFRPALITREKAAAFLQDKKNWLYAAIQKNKVIAFAYGYELNRLDHQGPMLYLHEVGVQKDLWKKGIGTSLLSSLRKESLSQGISKIFLFTDQENVGANKLYQKLGAQAAHERDVVYFFDG